MLKLLVRESKDDIIRENMERIQAEFNINQVLLKAGWKFFEITFDSAVTNYKYPHKLGFTPKDVIQTSTSGALAVIWNYDLFDRTNLDITTSEAGVVRAFIGSYVESAGQV